MKRYWIPMILLCGAPFASRADEPLSAERYRERVVTYSQVLKQAREQTIASIAGEKSARTGYLPKIDAGANATLDLSNLNAFDSPTGVYRNYTYFAELKLTQPILNTAIPNQYKAARLETEMSRFSERLSLEQICYQADVTYWTAVANRDLYRATRDYYGTVGELQQIIRSRFEDGMIGKTDVLMIDTRRKEAELQLSIARKQELLAFQNLNILMGTNPDAETAVGDTITRPDSVPYLVSLEEVLHRRPDFQRALLDVDLQERYRKVALAKYNPQMGLSLAGGWGTQTPNYGEKSDFSGLAAVSLNIPLVYWGDRKQVSRQNRAYIRSKMLETERMEDLISVQLSAAVTNLRQTYEEIRLAEENLELAKENLDLTTFSYNEGRIPIVDVLSAQLSWIQACNSVISANLNYKVALADYRRTVSAPVEP